MALHFGESLTSLSVDFSIPIDRSFSTSCDADCAEISPQIPAVPPPDCDIRHDCHAGVSRPAPEAKGNSLRLVIKRCQIGLLSGCFRVAFGLPRLWWGRSPLFYGKDREKVCPASIEKVAFALQQFPTDSPATLARRLKIC